MLNREALLQLIAAFQEDPEALEYIQDALRSFEQYHAAVMEDQLFPLLYANGTLDGEEYRNRRAALDRTRTVHHNALLANVQLLNRMAAAEGLPPIYDGVVSEERPYRRQVANAVFAFLADVIDRRS